MQAEYPNKSKSVNWDPLNRDYPVRKFPETGLTSETIARKWRSPPSENIISVKHPVDVLKEYMRDYNLTKDCTKSQSALDFDYKHCETERFNKNTPSTENHYIYPPSRRPLDPIWYKELEPLDTTHEGFEKYLDPYLTTSRLHHRPYTADQLGRPSVNKDIVTYYTCADVTWVRSPKPETNDWRLVNLRPKSTCDREKFKQEPREIRTHNKLNWVPGSFRTEIRDNYSQQSSRPKPTLQKFEDEVKSFYEHSLIKLPTKIPEEDSTISNSYYTENSVVGSGNPLCSVINQHVEKNKR